MVLDPIRFLPGGLKPFYPYKINQSVMFDSVSNSYMSRGSTGANGTLTKASFSIGIKRTKLGATHNFLTHYGSSSNHWYLQFTANDTLKWLDVFGASNTIVAETTAKFRDCAGWYYIVLAFDSTEAAQADRLKLWVNGNLTPISTATIGLNESSISAYTSYTPYIGSFVSAISPFNGYFADFKYFGQDIVIAETDVGQFKNGIWVPKAYEGSYGTGGYALDFADDADLGKDVSGNGFDFNITNMDATHQVLDSPTNNYCILDHNNMRANMTALKEGGLSPQDAGAAWHTALGTFLMKTGKWYWEIDIGADTDSIETGILASGEHSGDVIISDMNIGGKAQGFAIRAASTVFKSANNAATVDDDNLPAPGADDVMMVAFDADNNKIWFGVNGTWGDFGPSGVGDPANGNNPVFDNSDGIDSDLYDYVPGVSVYAHSTGLINFGQRAFAHTPPSGFKALCTENLVKLATPFSVYSNCTTEDEQASGTYDGNGNANGPYIYCGFKPTDVCIDNTHYDGSSSVIEIKSNGFKIIHASTKNVNDTSYAWEAWVDQDFKYANAA